MVGFEGVSSVEQAEGLVGLELRVPEETLQPLGEGSIRHICEPVWREFRASRSGLFGLAVLVVVVLLEVLAPVIAPARLLDVKKEVRLAHSNALRVKVASALNRAERIDLSALWSDGSRGWCGFP